MPGDFVTHRELEQLMDAADRERQFWTKDLEDFKKRVETMDAAGTRGLPLVSAQLTQALLELGTVRRILEDRPWERQMVHHEEGHERLVQRIATLETENAAKKHTNSSIVTILSLLAAVAMAVMMVVQAMHG